MKLPSFLALNANHRAIGRPHIGGSIQRYLDGKGRGPPTSKDLNAGDGLATGPLPDGVEALFPESHVVYADCLGYHHAGRTALNAADYAPAALLSKSKGNAGLNRQAAKSPACRGVQQAGPVEVRLGEPRCDYYDPRKASMTEPPDIQGIHRTLVIAFAGRAYGVGGPACSPVGHAPG